MTDGANMSDFRVSVSSNREDFEQELDWTETEARWTLSEREIGLGTMWEQGKEMDPAHVRGLLTFFRLSQSQAKGRDVRVLSPGDLVELHQESTQKPSLYAYSCRRCGRHWRVLVRSGGAADAWVVYGRTCQYTWDRGRPFTRRENAILDELRNAPSRRPGVRGHKSQRRARIPIPT